MLAGLRCWEDQQALSRGKFVHMWLKKVSHCCVGQLYLCNLYAEVLNLTELVVLYRDAGNYAYQSVFLFAGELTRNDYENMRREASSIRIQKDLRMHLARKAYKELCLSAVSIQSGMRGMAARNELRFRRRTRAAIVIQVDWHTVRIRLTFSLLFLTQ